MDPRSRSTIYRIQRGKRKKKIALEIETRCIDTLLCMYVFHCGVNVMQTQPFVVWCATEYNAYSIAQSSSLHTARERKSTFSFWGIRNIYYDEYIPNGIALFRSIKQQRREMEYFWHLQRPIPLVGWVYLHTVSALPSYIEITKYLSKFSLCLHIGICVVKVQILGIVEVRVSI